jgi:hypothetical protein
MEFTVADFLERLAFSGMDLEMTDQDKGLLLVHDQESELRV